MNASENLNELFTALSRAQGELTDAHTRAINPHFNSRYADLPAILEIVRPTFSRHGLSIVQLASFDGNYLSVETVIGHSSGQFISSSLASPLKKLSEQAIGSAITYMRRYSLAAAAGIAQKDDDGNAAEATYQPEPVASASHPIASAMPAGFNPAGLSPAPF